MTTRATADERATGRIEDDHRELRSRLDALTKTADRTGVLSGLQELAKLLGEHFADEEVGGGLYEDLVRRSPNLGEALDVLRREHREILEDLEALGHELESPADPQARLSEDTRRSITRCADRLRRHEHAESEMIADVYYAEEGGQG